MTGWYAAIKWPADADSAVQVRELREQLPVLVTMLLDEGADAAELEGALSVALEAVEDHDGG